MFALIGVFHLIHTAFEEYVFLVVENQMIVEMDKKLNTSLETHIKKGQLVIFILINVAISLGSHILFLILLCIS